MIIATDSYHPVGVKGGLFFSEEHTGFYTWSVIQERPLNRGPIIKFLRR